MYYSVCSLCLRYWAGEEGLLIHFVLIPVDRADKRAQWVYMVHSISVQSSSIYVGFASVQFVYIEDHLQMVFRKTNTNATMFGSA